MSRYILFLTKVKGRASIFVGEFKEVGAPSDYPREHVVAMRDKKVSPFEKFKILPPLLCYLLDLLTNKYSRV